MWTSLAIFDPEITAITRMGDESADAIVVVLGDGGDEIRLRFAGLDALMRFTAQLCRAVDEIDPQFGIDGLADQPVLVEVVDVEVGEHL